MLIILAQISCDATGCKSGHWADSAAGAWTELHAQGWRRTDEKHYCPEHHPVDPRVIRIRELAATGLSDAKIGARVGLSRGGVQSLRHAHGIPGRRPGRPNSTRQVVPA